MAYFWNCPVCDTLSTWADDEVPECEVPTCLQYRAYVEYIRSEGHEPASIHVWQEFTTALDEYDERQRPEEHTVDCIDGKEKCH